MFALGKSGWYTPQEEADRKRRTSQKAVLSLVSVRLFFRPDMKANLYLPAAILLLILSGGGGTLGQEQEEEMVKCR